MSFHSCKQSIVCGILLWSAPLFPQGWRLHCTWARCCGRGCYADSSSTSSRSRCPLHIPLLRRLCCFRFVYVRGVSERRLVVEYVQTDTWKFSSSPWPLKGSRERAMASRSMSSPPAFWPCVVQFRLTPCVGCHFKPGAIPRTFNRVSDSPR